MKTITTKQYYHMLRVSNPTPKKLVETMAKQLKVLRMIDTTNTCAEFKFRTRKQANNLIEACKLLDNKLYGGVL